MKARQLAFVKLIVAALLLASMMYWLIRTRKPLNEFGYVFIGIVLVAVAIALYSAYQAFKSARAGLNLVDELSIRVTQKAAANAFKASIYMWLVGLFVLDVFHIDSVGKAKLVIAIGMVCMALIFQITRFYYSRVGVHDNED